MGENPFVSVVIPVKNEAGILRDCLESLSRLDYPKERLEIILADGRSTDNTKEIGLAYGVKIVTNAKGIVSSGRNRGFEEAKGELIAFTDADCIFDVSWLKNSPKYFSDEKVAGIGGMTFAPRESSNFEKAIDFIFRLAELFQVTSHRRGSPIAKEVKDIPGCNAIYRKEALAKIMPIDEGLLTAEDVWMNFSLRKSGYRFIPSPDIPLRDRQAAGWQKGFQFDKYIPYLCWFWHSAYISGIYWFLFSGRNVYIMQNNPMLIFCAYCPVVNKNKVLDNSRGHALSRNYFYCFLVGWIFKGIAFSLKGSRWEIKYESYLFDTPGIRRHQGCGQVFRMQL